VRELYYFINSDLLNREDSYEFANQNERVVQVKMVGQKNRIEIQNSPHKPLTLSQVLDLIPYNSWHPNLIKQKKAADITINCFLRYGRDSNPSRP